VLKNYIELSLKKIGVKKNDIIFVHTDIVNLPIFVHKTKNIKKKVKLFCDYIFESLTKVVSNKGIIIVPTFNYDFCKTKKFSVQNTPSQVGIFTEYMRKHTRTIRTANPIHSVAIFGFFKKEFAEEISNNCFGSNSIFERIYDKNAWIIFLGTTIQSCTFVHRCEELADVPYRFYKKFSGHVLDKKKKSINHLYYCRYKNKYKDYDNGNTDHSKLEKVLLKKNYLIKPFKKFEISGIKAASLQDYLVRKLKKNPFYLLKKNDL
jgi:aminoglycoside 3-N-acetyltransferase